MLGRCGGLVATTAGEVPHGTATVTWHLVTAPDEQQRCCVVIDGHRCEQATVFKVASDDGMLDDYTYVCEDHLSLVNKSGYIVTRVERAD
jgi:hypothetical protein